MDYRSAGLIVLSALTMWAQHRHDHLGPARAPSRAVEARHEACPAAEQLVFDRNGGFAVVEDSDGHLLSALAAVTHVGRAFQQGVATLQRTLDEVEKAALLLGWQVLGDQRPLLALLHARAESVVRCPRGRMAALELVIPPTRVKFAPRTALTR